MSRREAASDECDCPADDAGYDEGYYIGYSYAQVWSRMEQNAEAIAELPPYRLTSTLRIHGFAITIFEGNQKHLFSSANLPNVVVH